MIEMTPQALADVMDLALPSKASETFRGVTIDSRKDCSGQLFVAIRGDRFDGHDYVSSAYKNGAVVALVETLHDCEIPQLLVPDCKQAMALLANHWRHVCNPLVIGLTGSNGKTTVKEMLHQILEKEAFTNATRGNFNNDIGVPLTLFELSREDRYAIIEMGANHPGEIAKLATIAEPQIVYVNNVAAAHLTGFGSVQGVIESKGELYAYCQNQQLALFNADEVASRYWRSICAADQQFSCGLNADADFSANWDIQDETLLVEFIFRGEQARVVLNLLGEHNVRNALAAVSIATIAGLEFKTAVENLSGFAGVSGRLQLMQGPQNSRLINDSYNANPDSLEAGIKVLCSLKGSAWLALGDMGELGSETRQLHLKAAQTARANGVEKLFGIGEMSCLASEEFGDCGYCFEQISDMSESILQQIHEDVNLLVKGSRSAGMDKLVEALQPGAQSRGINHVV